MIRFIFALLPAIALLIYQNSDLSIITIIILGQAHFFLTYLYQFRAGKITRFYIASYVILLASTIWIVATLPFNLLASLTAAIFSIHYLYDEIRILESNNKTISFTLLSIPIIFFVAYILNKDFQIDVFNYAIGILIFLTAVTYLRFGVSTLISRQATILNLFTISIFLMYAFGVSVPGLVFWGAIIIHHYGTWYIHQYFKFRSDALKLGKYLTDVLTINMLFIVMYIIYVNVPSMTSLRYLFSEEFFYGWTILHVLFSSQDLYKALLSRLANFSYRIRKLPKH